MFTTVQGRNLLSIHIYFLFQISLAKNLFTTCLIRFLALFSNVTMFTDLRDELGESNIIITERNNYKNCNPSYNEGRNYLLTPCLKLEQVSVLPQPKS